MTTGRKRIWWALALLIAVAAVIGVLWERPPRLPSQFVTLPNGEKYQFAGLTYSTVTVPPMLAARVISVLPTPLANLARKHFGARLSQYNAGQQFLTPQLFVWFHPLGTNVPSATGSPSLTAVLADQAGVIAGAQGNAAFWSSVAWSYASFPVVPRRSRVLQCYFYTSGFGSAALSPCCTISFPNPLYGRFPQWQPEPVPTVKKAGDLEVRLDEMVAGHPLDGPYITKPNGSYGRRYAPVQGGALIQSGFDISLRSSKGTNEVWALHGAELSDATGNVLRAIWFIPNNRLPGRHTQPRSPDWVGYSESIWGTLWPDEAAWRLKLELKRAAGFAPAELVTFRNVPLLKAGATSSIFMTNTLGQFQVVLEEHIRWGAGMVRYYGSPKFHLEILNAPDDLAADVVRVTADTGAQVSTGSGTDMGPGSGKASLQRFYSIFAPTNATALDITWVVQKTRSVEFLVKPPKAESQEARLQR